MAVVKTNEERIQATARAIFAATREDKPSLLSPERWQGEMMEWAMSDERLKVEMLRFVDVFPTLRNRSDVAWPPRRFCAGASTSPATARRWPRSRAGS